VTDEPTQALSTGDAPARTIAGRYRLDGLVGRGGSAEVWGATDGALDRRVALKLVTASGGEDSGRVGDEARLLARLSHPGLVPVYDAGTDDGGRPYVVMELVEGETLADVVRRGPVPPAEVARAGQGLAQALSYVHAQGLVHRDVKPANVLVGRDGRVRLTDFGIARLVDGARVTATGLTVGTASYLSPEQVTGRAVGPATDVYALGLVLLECLTGEREYPGAAIEVAVARLHRQPDVPDTLPSGWPGLLRAMTAREPEDRPSTDEVAAELGSIVAGGDATTVLAPAPAADRTQVIDRTQLLTRAREAPRAGRAPAADRVPSRAAPVRRRRGRGPAFVIALVLLLAVLAGAGYAIVQSGSQQQDPTGPPVQVDKNLPSRLQNDVKNLQNEVQP